MQIRNMTTYRKRDLRNLFSAAFKAEGVNPAGYTITVVYTKYDDGYISGNGTYPPGRRIRMRLPRTHPISIDVMARVFVHEIGHTLGLRHKEMIELSKIPTEWTAGHRMRRYD